jgi:hypothetical protein
MRVGPFWRQIPSATTTCMAEWRWCYLWLDEQGRTYAVEWM